MLWGDHQLRFELTPTTDGVRLVLLHIFDEAAEAPDYASGWHLCLNVVMAQLDGKDVPSAAGRRSPHAPAGNESASSTHDNSKLKRWRDRRRFPTLGLGECVQSVDSVSGPFFPRS